MAAEVISLKPRQRIAARLLAAIDGGSLGGTPTLRVSQELLGEMLGLTRKTVNSHLSHFENLDLIRSGYGKIKILNADGLRDIANS